MKTKQQYKLFYEERIRPKLGGIEQEKNKIRNKKNKAMTIYFIISILVAMLALSRMGLFSLFFVFLLVIIGLIVNSYYSGQFTKIFKSEIINEIIKFFGEDLTYSPSEHITKNEYRDSKLYGSFDRYSGEDLISGKLYLSEQDQEDGNGINIRMSEVHTEDKSTDSKGNTSYSTIFKGIFMIVDFNKSFKSSTYVVEDSGILNCLVGISGSKRVKLEDVEFEKIFEVYSEDQIEARYILTPSFMEKLKRLKIKTDGRLRIAFSNHKMYLAISTHDNLLEANLSQSMECSEDLAIYYEQLNFYFSIIEDLKLNEKIWK